MSLNQVVVGHLGVFKYYISICTLLIREVNFKNCKCLNTRKEMCKRRRLQLGENDVHAPFVLTVFANPTTMAYAALATVTNAAQVSPVMNPPHSGKASTMP